MTQSEFYTALAATNKSIDWEIEDGMIVGYDEEIRFCPLTAINYCVNGDYYDPDDFEQAGVDLGLDEEFYENVQLGADNDGDCESVTVRCKLIKTLGL